MMDEEEFQWRQLVQEKCGDTNGAIIFNWNAYHNWEYLKWPLDVKEHYLWQIPVEGHWYNIVSDVKYGIIFKC